MTRGLIFLLAALTFVFADDPDRVPPPARIFPYSLPIHSFHSVGFSDMIGGPAFPLKGKLISIPN